MLANLVKGCREYVSIRKHPTIFGVVTLCAALYSVALISGVLDTNIKGEKAKLEAVVERPRYYPASEPQVTFEDAHKNGSYAEGYVPKLPPGIDDLPLEVEKTYFNLLANQKKLKDFKERLKNTDQYDHFIKEASKESGVPSSLLKAIIARESNGNPKAVSRKGARGLMQLMSETAEWLSPECLRGIDDPRTNIRCGAEYLKRLEKKYGDVTLTLAAYNWGPGKVDRLRREVGEEDLFARLPAGTKQYVTEVLVLQCLVKDSYR